MFSFHQNLSEWVFLLLTLRLVLNSYKQLITVGFCTQSGPSGFDGNQLIMSARNCGSFYQLEELIVELGQFYGYMRLLICQNA